MINCNCLQAVALGIKAPNSNTSGQPDGQEVGNGCSESMCVVFGVHVYLG